MGLRPRAHIRIDDVIECIVYKGKCTVPSFYYPLQCSSTMPLFKRSPTPPPAPVQETLPRKTPRRRGALFSSSRTADNATTTTSDTGTTAPNDNGSSTGTSRIGGFFRRRSTGSSDFDSTGHTQRRRGSVGSGPTARTGSQASQAGRNGRGKDRSIDAARHKVTLAEKAEKDADA